MRRLLFATVMAFAAAPAFAQISPPTMYIPPAQQLWTVTQEEADREEQVPLSQPDVAGAIGRGAAASQPASGSPLLYSFSAERSSENQALFVERFRQANPPAAGMLENIYATTDVPRQLGGFMRQVGLDDRNVADVYALWWVSSWLVANSRHDMPSRATFSAVSEQAHIAFANTADYAEMDDAQRQRYAEALMMHTTLLTLALDEVRGDREGERQLAAMAERSAAEDGVDLRSMILTEEGFVPREGADASDAVQGGNAEALAAAGVTGSGDAPLYLGLAAAATAVLGGAYILGRKSA